ncbi:MAG TPA: CRISPR-associated endoribonuclease Cas6 [Tissierellaceae bacterium]|nr:CRISPR-associated endoribonuclease Cas6 [Tissierellaceae bacterium]
MSVELLLNNNKLNKDKNRIVMHIIKLLIEKEDKEMFNKMYRLNINKQKDLTFSMYLGRDAKFLRNEIEVPAQKVIVNFSTSDSALGITIYNAFTKYKGLEIPIKDNMALINKVNIVKTRPITSEKVRFITKSPIVVRSHNGDNEKTYYNSLLDESGQEVFIENLKYQIKDKFPDISMKDLKQIKINIIWSKDVKVKHYEIIIPSNICEFEIEAKTYILEEIYLNGVGGRKSQGFGYVDLVE